MDSLVVLAYGVEQAPPLIKMEWNGAETFWRVSASTEAEYMTKWLIIKVSNTYKQQQCGYDVVGLDRREMWAVTCWVYGHWRTDDETVVITKSEPLQWRPGQRGCRPMAACRNQVPLTAVAETWLKPRWPKPKPGRMSLWRQFWRRNQSRSRNSVGF